MERLGECTGNRGGTWYHKFDGFYYKVNTKRYNRLYMMCAIHLCPVRAMLPENEADRIVKNLKVNNSHNHPPNYHLPQLLDLRRTLKARCANELTPIRQIYDEEIAKVPEPVREMISYTQFSHTMHKHRHSITRKLMDAVQDGREGEFFEVSEVEYEENPAASGDDSGEKVQYHYQPVNDSAGLKRKRRKIIEEPNLKVNDCFEYEGETTFETTYHKEEVPPDETFDEEENYVDNDKDLDEYLSFYEADPKPYLTNPCNILLSIFFKDMEKTVRSFLPSVVIEAKGRIARLIHKLEMKNWKLEQLIEEKDGPKLERLRQKEKIKQEQILRVKQNAKMILETQAELIQKKLDQKQNKKKENKKKRKPSQYIEQPELVENYQLVDEDQLIDEQHELTYQQHQLTDEQHQVTYEQHQFTDEPYELTDEQDQLTEEQHQLIVHQNLSVNEQNQTTANSDLIGQTVRILSSPGNFQNVRFLKAKVISIPKRNT